MAIQNKLGEFEEFAEALFDQLSVEINEEKEIAEVATKASEENVHNDSAVFGRLEDVAVEIFPSMRRKAEEFLGIHIPDDTQMQFPELVQFKRLKGKKVFADEQSVQFVKQLFEAVAMEDLSKIVELMSQNMAKYLVYSTYAIQYISKITTTYGDYLDSVIYLNKFILSRYPQIILHRQEMRAGTGNEFENMTERVNSGYAGAIKMTVLEELVHCTQDSLQQTNKNAAMSVNKINEELAGIVLALDDKTVSDLAEYCQLQAVPDDFPFAKRANLFFFLNPDHFLIEQIGPDVMTFTHVEIDPKIGAMIPQLLDIYKRWLVPIQKHHAAFATMEGMAGFAVRNILGDDPDFQNYLSTFMGTDISSYQVRKGMGMDFVKSVYEERGQAAFKEMLQTPPNTRELKDSQQYLKRLDGMAIG